MHFKRELAAVPGSSDLTWSWKLYINQSVLPGATGVHVGHSQSLEV